MQTGTDIDVDLVILDEAHYLGDIDRGVVWEEVLIYLPARVRLLMLSATISNAAAIARWLTHIRSKSCSVVYSGTRPVPLHVLFRTPGGELTPFLRGQRLFPKVTAYAQAEKGGKRVRESRVPEINGIVETLREFQLLPAIIFLKSRSDCDSALQALLPTPSSPEEGDFADTVKDQLAAYPELMRHRQLGRLLHCRAGSHHAGQLPGWRLLIEKMMVLGHLEVIFSTSTVAAGVDFPADGGACAERPFQRSNLRGHDRDRPPPNDGSGRKTRDGQRRLHSGGTRKISEHRPGKGADIF